MLYLPLTLSIFVSKMYRRVRTSGGGGFYKFFISDVKELCINCIELIQVLFFLFEFSLPFVLPVRRSLGEVGSVFVFKNVSKDSGYFVEMSGLGELHV